MTERRTKTPSNTTLAVLTEAGFRCAVPTCRAILAIDLHHLEQVSEGGGNVSENLLALCPTCHALYHRGTIPRESLYTWKAVLVSLSRAFDTEALDLLLFLDAVKPGTLSVSGDGVLRFACLVAAGLVGFERIVGWGSGHSNYNVRLTNQGRLLISVWKSGKRDSLAEALSSQAAAS